MNNGISQTTKLLAIFAALTSAAGLVAISFLAPIIPSILLIGALTHSRAPQLGKWLMWLGAPLLSVPVVGAAIGMLNPYVVQWFTKIDLSLWNMESGHLHSVGCAVDDFLRLLAHCR